MTCKRTHCSRFLGGPAHVLSPCHSHSTGPRPGHSSILSPRWPSSLCTGCPSATLLSLARPELQLGSTCPSDPRPQLSCVLHTVGPAFSSMLHGFMSRHLDPAGHSAVTVCASAPLAERSIASEIQPSHRLFFQHLSRSLANEQTHRRRLSGEAELRQSLCDFGLMT